MRTLTIARRLIFATWLGLGAIVVMTVVVGHGAPLLGYRPVIIRGPSMSPTLSVGELAFEQQVPAGDLRQGDIVTFTMPNGLVITHRIVNIARTDSALLIETQGDSNPTADAVLHPADDVSGVVRFALPLVGFLLAWMTLPTGFISVASMLGSLLISIWLIDDLERSERDVIAPVPAPAVDGLPA